MSAANAARFLIAGTPAEDPSTGNRGYDASNSEVLTLRVEDNPSTAISATFSVYDPNVPDSPLASLAADLLTFTGSGVSSETVTPASGTVELVMPGTGYNSWIVRCEAAVPNGVPHVFERMVVIRDGLIGLRELVPGESTQYSQRAWADEINQILASIVGSLGTSYTPNDANDWPEGAPSDTSGALDILAARTVVTLDEYEVFAAAARGYWFDADAFVDGASSLDLTDLFYNGNALTQATEAQKPGTGTDGAIRSAPVLYFSQADQNLAKASGLTIAAQDMDGLFLFRVDTWENDKDIVQMQNAGDTDYVILKLLTGANRFQAYTADVGLRPTTTEVPAAGAYGIARVRRTTSGPNVTIGITGQNGTEQTATAAATAANLSKIWLGGEPGGGKTPKMTFKRALVVEGTTLSLSARKALTRKWNRELGLNLAEPTA